MDARTVIIGAGIAGSALAMHLAEGGDDDVLVIDPSLSGELSSSERNAGGVRATWWQMENVQLCAETIAHMAEHAQRLGLRQDGYTWLHSSQTWEGALRAMSMQNDLGLGVIALTPESIRATRPELAPSPDVHGATVSPFDGLVNPNSVRELYRERARKSGARFLDRTLLIGSITDRNTVPTLVTAPIDDADVRQALDGRDRRVGAARRIRAERVVNAAGPWAGQVSRRLGYHSPAHPSPRELAVFRSPYSLEGKGMLVLDSGCYVHHESGDLHLAGWSPDDDSPRISFAHEGRRFFEREVWPRLAERIPAMESLDYVRGWTGLYDLSPDRSAICGPVAQSHGFAGSGLFEIHSFSGRGVMQSWAMARLLAREILGDGTDPRRMRFDGRRFGAGGWRLDEALHI